MGIKRLTATVMIRPGKWRPSVVSVTTILVVPWMCTKMPTEKYNGFRLSEALNISKDYS
jgi:hypothetical protein